MRIAREELIMLKWRETWTGVYGLVGADFGAALEERDLRVGGAVWEAEDEGGNDGLLLRSHSGYDGHLVYSKQDIPDGVRVERRVE